MSPRNFLFWSLIAIVTLAPLPFGSNRPWAWALLSLLVGLLVIAWVIAAARDHSMIQIEWRRSRLIVVPFSILMFWFLIQASGITPESWHHPLWQEASSALGMPISGAISLNPEASHTAVMRLLAYGGVFWLAFQFGRDKRHAKQAFWAIAIAGVLYAVYGIGAHASGNETILWYAKSAYRDSLTSTFINRNSYAMYASITLVVTLALLLAEIRRVLRYSPISSSEFLAFFDACGLRFYFLVVAAGTIFTALLLTQSRGGLLGFTVGIGAFILISRWRLKNRKKSFPLLPMIIWGGLALGSAGGILLMSGDGTINRIDATFSVGDDRIAIYQGTIEAIQDAPVTGMGLGTFKDSFYLYRDEAVRFYVNTIDRAHNTYLEFALEGGLPALLLMTLLVFYIALLCFLGALSRKRNALYPTTGVAVTILVGTHALVDFSLQIPAVVVTYLLILGVTCAQSWSSRDIPAKTN